MVWGSRARLCYVTWLPGKALIRTLPRWGCVWSQGEFAGSLDCEWVGYGRTANRSVGPLSSGSLSLWAVLAVNQMFGRTQPPAELPALSPAPRSSFLQMPGWPCFSSSKTTILTFPAPFPQHKSPIPEPQSLPRAYPAPLSCINPHKGAMLRLPRAGLGRNDDPGNTAHRSLDSAASSVMETFPFSSLPNLFICMGPFLRPPCMKPLG